jgi:7-cyano-7-deazaguanine synthase
VSKSKKAVVLSSGGVDSTTAMAIARSEGYDIYSLSFRYGQRHALELEASRRLAKALGAREHRVMDIDLKMLGGSALTDNIDVPKGRTEKEMGREIPITYVPARNTIFLSYALAWAEVLGASDIFVGVNAVDYSGYIRKGVALGVDYRMTHSCYDPSPDGKACGQCDSCLLRKKGFKEAGFSDPAVYAS